MRSGFFNSNIEGTDEYGNYIYDRAEEASFFAEFFASFIGNGVYPNPSTGMQVMANGGMNLKIQPGKCFINGYFGLVEEGGEIITIEPADANYSRIDRVVARWDLELRKIIPYILKGTPASNPVAPNLTRNSNIYEIALADITVKANSTTITQANITDRRLDTSLCGIVSGVIDQVDTATLFNQYLTWFEERKQESADDYQEWFTGFTEPSEEQFAEWFNQMKNQLSEDAAGNLQLQVDDLKEDGIIVSPTEPTTDRRKVWFQKGKNCIDESLLERKTLNGVTSSIADGKIVLNGTATASNIFCIPIYLTKGTYIFSWYGKHAYPYFTLRDKNGGFISSFESSGESETSNRVLTVIEENDYIIGINIKAEKVYNAENTSFNIQIEEGTEETNYETYINPTIYTKNNNTYESFLKQALEKIKRETLKAENPVGHIRMETTDVNPSTYLGFGTWILWGSGRVPVGVNTADTDFATVEKTGGSKTVKLTLAQIPAHTHTFTGKAHTHGLNSHTHTYSKSATTTGSHTLTTKETPAHYHFTVKASQATATLSGSNCIGTYATSTNSDLPYSLRGVANAVDPTTARTSTVGGGGGHTHGITLTSTNSGQASGNTANATAAGTNSSVGGDETHTNVQPYITCYMWKRTA